MERSYLNTMIGFIAIFMFGAFLVLKPNDSADFNKRIQEVFTVNMPRPMKEFFASFSLDDRQVIRIVENSKTIAKSNDVAKKVDSKNGTQAAVDKKMTAVEKKRQEYRRQQYLYKQAQERSFRMRVVQESEKYRRELLRQEFQNISEMENSLKGAYQYAARKRETQNIDNSNPSNEVDSKDTLTADQWKSLMLSQPTRENALKLVEAFQNNEIDITSYNEIAELLIQDNSEEKKKIGIWVLTAATSVESFKLAAKTISTVSAENQQLLKDYVYSYSRPQTLSLLEQVLRSNDTESKTLAAQVISQGFEKVKSDTQVNSNSNRGNRNNIQLASSTINNYKKLVPTLQWLVTNPNSGLAQWAQGLLSQLQTSATPA